MTDVSPAIAKLKSTGAAQKPIGTVTRAVHRACKGCMAPGVYSHDPNFKGWSETQIADAIAQQPGLANMADVLRAGWPECYVAKDDPRCHTSVGKHCPHCGAKRPPPEKRRATKLWGIF